MEVGLIIKTFIMDGLHFPLTFPFIGEDREAINKMENTLFSGC